MICKSWQVQILNIGPVNRTFYLMRTSIHIHYMIHIKDWCNICWYLLHFKEENAMAQSFNTSLSWMSTYNLHELVMQATGFSPIRQVNCKLKLFNLYHRGVPDILHLFMKAIPVVWWSGLVKQFPWRDVVWLLAALFPSLMLYLVPEIKINIP